MGTILKSRYQPNGRRTLVKGYQAEPGSNLCSHDGECLDAGAQCVHWDANVGSSVLPLAHGALLEAYCGCVQKQCQWFTQPRPSIHAEFKTIDVEGWPERLRMNREDLELAVGGSFPDELKRCFVDHLKQLPQRITLRVEQKRDRRTQNGTVSGASSDDVAHCIERLFPIVQVPLNLVTDEELAKSPIALRTTILVNVKMTP